MPPRYKDAKEDAEELRDAMKGFGTDDSTLIQIICDRQPYQLQQIAEAYEEEFGKPLIKKIKSECRGDYETFLVGLLKTRAEYLTDSLKDAVEGLGTDDRALIDVLCSATKDDIEAIKEHDADVFDSVMGDVSGDFKKVLKSIFEGDRDDMDRTPDLARACKDVKRFYRAGEGQWGTNDEKFIQILTKRSNAHLQLVDRIYQKVHDKGMLKVIKGETGGSYESALKALLKPFDQYWAERLHKAMAGLGTNDDALIRGLLLCGKRKIPYVAKKYEELYDKSLADAIESETSGDYRKALLQFLNPAKSLGELRNPLAIYEEVDLDVVDEKGNFEGLEGPIPDTTYFICGVGDQEYPESFLFELKDGTDDEFYLRNREDKFLSAEGHRLTTTDDRGRNEEFKVVKHTQDPNNKFAILTANGYIHVIPDNGEWRCDGAAMKEWEAVELKEDVMV